MKLRIEVSWLCGFMFCLCLIVWGFDNIMRYIGTAGLIYLLKPNNMRIR